MNITYYPCGSRTTASSRLRVYKIAEILLKEGHNVTIAPVSFDAGNADVIVVQKRFDCVDEMKRWVKQGKRVIWDVDDWLPFADLPQGVQVTVDTAAKRELYPQAIVVPDALDVGRNTPRKMNHSNKLERVAWVGNPENWGQMRNVLFACEKLNIDVIAVTDTTSRHYAQYPNVVGVQWELESVDVELIQSDLLVCPFVFDGDLPQQWIKSKSANRVLKGWALGLPVAGTPIPAYIDIGLAYRATTVAQWIETLKSLKHKEAREIDAEAGYYVAQQYRAENIAKKWLEVFSE